MGRRHRRVPPLRSGFAEFRFPREVIVLAVRWHLRYGLLSYRATSKGAVALCGAGAADQQHPLTHNHTP